MNRSRVLLALALLLLVLAGGVQASPAPSDDAGYCCTMASADVEVESELVLHVLQSAAVAFVPMLLLGLLCAPRYRNPVLRSPLRPPCA